MPIVIKPLLPEQGEEALLFLQPYESECVNLASDILRGSTDCWALYYADQEVSQTKTLAGLFALRKKRSLFFCLPFAKYKSAFDKKVCSEAQRPLMEFFESNEPFCVNGEAAGAIFLRNILKNKKNPMRPSVTNKYFLMVSDAMSFPRSDAGIFQDKKIAGSSPAMTNYGFRASDSRGLRPPAPP